MLKHGYIHCLECPCSDGLQVSPPFKQLASAIDTKDRGFSFPRWLDEVIRIAAEQFPGHYLPNPVGECGADWWQQYYDEGMTPGDAITFDIGEYGDR